jgi:TPR repeat protein
MRAKLVIWTVIVAAVFASFLAAAPALVKAAHLHWPAWPIALAAAILTSVAGAAKPITDAISQKVAELAKQRISNDERARKIERDAGGPRKGFPLAGEISDRALLGIHPAIPLPPGADPELSPDLPLYVPRDVDADLYAWVTAHQHTGGFLLLVGPAAAGKTRCAYQLVSEALPDWPMFMPSTAAQLTEYTEANPAPGQLIIWLNDTHDFLGPGGLSADTVRRLLASPKPVVIIGTTWPDRYDALTVQQGARNPSGPQDALSEPGQDARQILTMLAYRRDLAAGFTSTERDRAQSIASRDPRITEALTSTDSPNVPETLAAKPDLIQRWITGADPAGAAIITAAVTARRCGHPEPLPAGVLKPLAEAALTSAQRAQTTRDWFEAGLLWARQPVRGNATPLTAQAVSPGRIDGDHVSDILVQYATRDPSGPWHTILDGVSQLIIDHATPRACRDIAAALYLHRHPQQTHLIEGALRKAVGNDDAIDFFNLGAFLHERGNASKAAQWYRKAADSGNTSAIVNLGLLLEQRGAADEAEQWYRTAADAGNTDAMFNLGVLLNQRGAADEAAQWYRTAADAGDTDAMANLGVVLREQGDADNAAQWYRKAADAGNTSAMFNLGNLLRKQGDAVEAEQWYRTAADAGNTSAIVNLGLLLEQRGAADEAAQWYRNATATDET